jgi:hypothetical protein
MKDDIGWKIRHPQDPRGFKASTLGEPVEEEIVVFLDANDVPVPKEKATHVRIVLYGKTKRHEVYGEGTFSHSTLQEPPE